MYKYINAWVLVLYSAIIKFNTINWQNRNIPECEN